MSRRRRLLCSLSILAVTLGAAGLARRADGAPVRPDAPLPMVDTNQTTDPAGTSLLTDEGTAAEQQPWTILWDDLALKDTDAPVVSSGAAATAPGTSVTRPYGAPPIIAAPLPPAIISGVIGLVGVYAYKRRNRFVNR
jgi:hypothetical protein